MTNVVRAYVDGFNLYNGIHQARGRRGLWLDLESLVGEFVPETGVLDNIDYFSALVHGEGRARQELWWKALHASCPKVTLHRGRFQKKKHRCFECGTHRKTFEEKESDVALAVKVVSDAMSGLLQHAIILSADSDMAPAIRAVKTHTDVFVTALFPPRRSSHDLRQLADRTLTLYDKLPERHQLPDIVTLPNGGRVERPEYWS